MSNAFRQLRLLSTRAAVLAIGLLGAFSARAEIYSPSSVEVHFSFSADFFSDEKGTAQDLALEHAKYLFGYMQNPEIVESYNLDDDIAGIGAPRWPPQISQLSETPHGRDREVRYKADGLMILNRNVAAQIFKGHAAGDIVDWKITLPYKLDLFYDDKCGNADEGQDAYWYVYDPFRAGCAHLRRGKLAHEVALHLNLVPELPPNTVMPLRELRADNGNGDTFEITSITGFFDDDATKADDGRTKFIRFNQWLKSQGFTAKTAYKHKKSELDIYTKDAKALDGHVVHIRVLRLLAPTEIDETADRTFTRFVEKAILTSDVLVYDGHSGAGVNLSLDQIAARAGAPVKFDPTKKQLFYFAACSSYSYYLGLFKDQKPGSSLAIMTNGIEADFTPAEGMMKAFYSTLFDLTKDDVSWGDMLKRMEAPMDGDTYMVNVSAE